MNSVPRGLSLPGSEVYQQCLSGVNPTAGGELTLHAPEAFLTETDFLMLPRGP
jgi:hypothetical protein